MCYRSFNHVLLLIGFGFSGMLGGCVFLEAYDDAFLEDARKRDYFWNQNRENYYEPKVTLSSESRIRVEYLDVNEYSRAEEVQQLIADHCGGKFFEAQRTKEIGITTIVAECE